MIQKDDRQKHTEFFKLKGKPETAANMVGIYTFVNQLCQKYVGQPVPFKSRRDYIIDEVSVFYGLFKPLSYSIMLHQKHILAALFIEDRDGEWMPRCRETLDLLKLYGKGCEFEDAGVVKLMEEKVVEYNAKPIKRLLHLLRDLDKSRKRP